jgi:ribosomal protein S18 acetylase RimI-like enzyme
MHHEASPQGALAGAVAVFSDLLPSQGVGEGTAAGRAPSFPGGYRLRMVHEVRNPLVSIAFIQLLPSRFDNLSSGGTSQAVAIEVDWGASTGELVPFPAEELAERLDQFWVVADLDQILGVCALRPVAENLAELCSLAVWPEWQRHGLGRRLVRACLFRMLSTASRQPIEAVDVPVPVDNTLSPHPTPPREAGNRPAPGHSRPYRPAYQLEQLFLNLCLNALEAMDFEGELTVRVADPSQGGDSTLLVEVSDSWQWDSG